MYVYMYVRNAVFYIKKRTEALYNSDILIEWKN